MALAEFKTAPLSLEEAVQTVWREVELGRAATATETVRVLWPLLTPEAVKEAAIIGLGYLANNQQTHARRNGKIIAFGRPHGRAWAPYMATLATPYTGADGNTKALLDFTAADFSAFEARCITIGTGWFERAKVAKQCSKLLAEHNVEVLADLPVEVLEDVAARFQAAFQ